MRIASCAVMVLGVVVAAAPVQAVYREPSTPPPEQGEQIPGKSIKLDTNTDTPPPAEKVEKMVEKKHKEREKEPERTVSRQRRHAPDDAGPPPRENGMSPDAARALGTAIGVGVGIGLGGGMGIGRHGGDDGGRMMGR